MHMTGDSKIVVDHESIVIKMEQSSTPWNVRCSTANI